MVILGLSCIMFVLVFGSLPTRGWGHEPRSLTLAEALAFAREHNPDLLSARQALVVAHGRLAKAQYFSHFNPELSASGAHRHFTDRPGSATDYDITLSHELEIAGQRSKRIAEAEAHLARVGQQVRNTERLILAQVKEAFYRALYLHQRLQLLQDIERLTRRLEEIAVSRFQAGEEPKIEVNIAGIRLGQARKEVIVAQRDSHAAVSVLEQLVGVEPTGQTRVVGELAVPSQALQEQTLLRQAMDNRPDLQAVLFEQQRVSAEIALTRRLAVPNLTVEAFYRQEEGEDTIVGGRISVSLPLFDRRQAELTQLVGQAGQAKYEQQSIELRIRQEVATALRSYEAARAEVAVFEQEVVDRAAENFRLMEAAYREGKIDLLHVIVVQHELVNAHLSYLESLLNYWLARTALERAVGADL